LTMPPRGLFYKKLNQTIELDIINQAFDCQFVVL